VLNFKILKISPLIICEKKMFILCVKLVPKFFFDFKNEKSPKSLKKNLSSNHYFV